MTEATQRNYRGPKAIVSSFLVGGIVAVLLGIASLAFGRGGVTDGVVLLFGGFATIAMSQLLRLLVEIASHLAAIRAQMGKGILGLF